MPKVWQGGELETCSPMWGNEWNEKHVHRRIRTNISEGSNEYSIKRISENYNE